MCGTQLLQGIFTKQNCLLPTAPWKRNSSKGKEENGLKSCFHRRRLSGFVHFSISWCCCQELGAKLSAENIRKVSSLFLAWFLAGESPCCQAAAFGQWDVGTNWWETCTLWAVRLRNIGTSLWVVFLFNYTMLISAGGWGGVSSWEKRSSVTPGAGSNVDWKVLLVNDYRRDQTQVAATWLPRVDFEVGCTFSTPGETGETSPLPHARNTAGGTLPVLGDVRIHCTKACSPCDPALPPCDGGPFPDLSRGGFPTGGVWVVRSHAGHFGGCVTVRWWGKESLTGSMVRKSQPAALLLHLLPIQLLVAQQPVLFQGPHPSPWGWLMAAREVTAVLPCTGRSYSRGEWGRREVGSMRVSQECFSITGTHFCSSQRCWKASYVTCCEGLGHSWSGICKQNQQFNLKKRQVVSHASSPLAYFRLPDLSALWCCLCHC